MTLERSEQYLTNQISLRIFGKVGSLHVRLFRLFLPVQQNSLFLLYVVVFILRVEEFS